jgi:N,N'-diacetyllegionaminate synthase
VKENINKTYIIAEIGINHEGDVNVCEKMVLAAAECGVDAVKLQTVDPGANYIKGAESYNIFKEAELTQNETSRIFTFAREHGLDIFTTSGDVETINWVDSLNPSHWKISSGLLTHIPIIKYLASLNRPLLISTGMASEEDIDLAVKTAKSTGNNNISLFQCTSIYPTPFDEVNLSAISWLKNKYKIPVGLSDHSNGDDAVFLSIAAGATLIEKHFSLDTNRAGYDHGVSLNKKGLKKMVERVRLAEIMMGNKKKVLSNEVKKTRDKFSRYIVATQSISVGDKFSTYNMGIKRTLPGVSGLEPKSYESIIGETSISNIRIDQPIQLKDFKGE